MRWIASAGALACLLSASAAHAPVLHLRARRAKQVPVVTVAAPAPAATPLAGTDAIAATFAKMDANNDGKVDVNEFVVAEQSGVFPLASAPAAPAPAPWTAVAPAPASLGAPVPGPAGSAAGPSKQIEEELPPHLLIPPPLPQNIPEPPPPPRPPPPEPAPPPMPPKEGQLVQAPPSESSVEAAGNLTEMMAGVPGLDLDGKDPVQSPNTPPPLPVPLAPPNLPKVIPEMEPPEQLPEALMTPAPVAFGLDMGRALPVKMPPLKVVTMAPPVQLTEKGDHYELTPDSDPFRVFLSISSHRHAAVAAAVRRGEASGGVSSK